MRGNKPRFPLSQLKSIKHTTVQCDHLNTLYQACCSGCRSNPAKYHAAESAKRVLNLALDVLGGGGTFKGGEFERLYRDVAMGGVHPANSPLTHEIVGKTHLGVLGQQPRWG